jgi:hypothetical protein
MFIGHTQVIAFGCSAKRRMPQKAGAASAAYDARSFFPMKNAVPPPISAAAAGQWCRLSTSPPTIEATPAISTIIPMNSKCAFGVAGVVAIVMLLFWLRGDLRRDAIS